MQPYSEYAPTGFDDKGIVLDERQDWKVLPCGQNRDSTALDLSNFENALEILGGESETVEVHRFGHWGCGWLEIIIVKPDTEEHVKALDIESRLADYPVLNDEDHSEREYDECIETIENIVPSEFHRFVPDIFSALNCSSPDDITTDDVMKILTDPDGEMAVRCADCGELADWLESGNIGTCNACTSENMDTLKNALLIAYGDSGISETTRYAIGSALGFCASPYTVPNLLSATA